MTPVPVRAVLARPERRDETPGATRLSFRLDGHAGVLEVWLVPERATLKA